MSKLDFQPVQRNYAELNQRVIDLIEGRGSKTSRKLTREMLKTFPSVVELVSSEYQQQLSIILSREES
jgi:hypothetical protein